MKIGATYAGDNKTKFTVWAPLKNKMMLHIVHPVDKKIAMQKDEWGYFNLETEAEPGYKYFFRPEDDKDIPDPASQYQPEDVHGPSEVIDHTVYIWSDDQWKGLPFAELILYELHVG